MNAKTFASLVAGIEIPVSGDEKGSDAEVMGKFKQLRRMCITEGVRIIDALEMPEIVAAIDEQLKPERRENPYISRLEARLKEREKETGELIDHYKSLLAQKQEEDEEPEPKPRIKLRDFLEDAWYEPQVRAALVLLYALCALTVGIQSVWLGIIAGVVGLWLFVGWCAVECADVGWFLLLVKVGITITAVANIPTGGGCRGTDHRGGCPCGRNTASQ